MVCVIMATAYKKRYIRFDRLAHTGIGAIGVWGGRRTEERVSLTGPRRPGSLPPGRALPAKGGGTNGDDTFTTIPDI